MTNPVTVIIPGFMGSSLVNALTGRKLWDGARQLWTDPRILQPSTDGLGDAAPGMKIEPLADLWPVYRGLVRCLRSHGHRVHFFPYDWRRPIEQALERFRKFAEERIPEPRFNIVAHSMGSMAAALWLAEGGAERLARAVFMALPARGSEMAATALLLGNPRLAFFNVRADNALLREMAWAIPSIYQMLPPLPGIFEPQNWPEATCVIAAHLQRARQFQSRWNLALSRLEQLRDRSALIVGLGEKLIGWRPSPDGRFGVHCRTEELGDGWMSEQSDQTPGLPAYGFKKRLADALRLGFFVLLPYIVGTHPVLPMFKRVQRTILEFLETGKVKSLPKIKIELTNRGY
jgi:pimeloyl-ACP methyl ester carboxylesterase